MITSKFSYNLNHSGTKQIYVEDEMPSFDDLLYVPMEINSKSQTIKIIVQEDEILEIRPITDRRAIEVLSKLEKERKEGKRKTISHNEFISKYKHLTE